MGPYCRALCGRLLAVSDLVTVLVSVDLRDLIRTQWVCATSGIHSGTNVACWHVGCGLVRCGLLTTDGQMRSAAYSHCGLGVYNDYDGTYCCGRRGLACCGRPCNGPVSVGLLTRTLWVCVTCGIYTGTNAAGCAFHAALYSADSCLQMGQMQPALPVSVILAFTTAAMGSTAAVGVASCLLWAVL